MGLTKQYLRYVPSAVFGVIGCQKANIAFVTLRGGEKGRYVAVGACEHVFIWDVRKAEKVLILEGKKHEVTYICPSPDGVHVAVGYEDGGVRIFSLLNCESNIVFSGHKSAVSVIKYDALGARLVTGSRDTDVIVWDIINESGLYRLKGHKDAITQVLFLESKNLLITSSKDSFVKWWDLETQHCFKTMVGHRTEVWGMVLLNQGNRLLTGSTDSELRAWDIEHIDEGKEVGEPREKKVRTLLEEKDDNDDAGDVDEEPEDRILACKKAGSILREARDRVVSLVTDAKAKVFACHGLDANLEVFMVLSEEEIQKKMDRKLKKARKKSKPQVDGEEASEPVVERKLKDEIQKLANIKASSKIRSVDCLLFPNGEMKVALLQQNNVVEMYTLKITERKPTGNKTSRLTLGGHRTDVRTLAFSSDNIAVLSASGESVKVWNRSTLQVVRTMACEYALCSLFVPGTDRLSLGLRAGKFRFLTWLQECFWKASMPMRELSGPCVFLQTRRLTVKHTRTLQLDEDVLCVRLSPDQRLLAVSLLDCTVKVFYTDTLKFFLSLYGHKLPVLCLDISHDSALIATGSADKNVKVWGLDFGDCHRSMFAHEDSVMFLQFVPKTHLFFTAGKDRRIKQWDADKFEHIQTLEGHHREVWCLAISPSGDHIVSSSHDKSLRLWERTREPIILEEEKEMVREAEFEESMDKGDEPIVPGETKGEAEPAGKKTIETVKAAERIMEAIELYREESKKLEDHREVCEAAGKELPPPKMNPILVAFGNISPSRYVLEVIKKVRSRVHFGQITSNQMLVSVIDDLRTNTISKVHEIRDVLGFNSAGLHFLQQEIETKEDVMFFADATERFEEKKRKRRKRERAILTIT
ncbi:hypothetical protein DNTS_013231 [Danionella cerebrum]|uniref:Uncharacterized protein n=1 Tax=Danionella cerebrum TaxID=2873325 RepID=A0A553N0Z0_9TELE|nr:hypothetical protein DNTS_013231 [Danionella translucida]